MSGTDDKSHQLAEAVRLATALSDRVLNAQFLGQQIAPQQVEALVKAAGLFQDLGEPWPSMLTQALHEIAETAQESSQEAGDASASAIDALPSQDASGDGSGMKGFLARVRRRKS